MKTTKSRLAEYSVVQKIAIQNTKYEDETELNTCICHELLILWKK